ncbi:MAG: glycosyltransferase family 2 protein, partial [Chthoniobacterales bacterium]
MTDKPSIAVVVPFFNEERNVDSVCSELRSVLEKEIPGSEAILVNDGSIDRTGPKLEEIAAAWPECRVFHLEENRGQSAALLFGFARSAAQVFVTMDGDGQNDPHDIPRLLARLTEVEMAVGARVKRQDRWIRRAISKIANAVRSHLLADGVSDAGCALKAFRREVVGAFIPLRTLYSFMPALAVAAGFRVLELPVSHRQRPHGSSHYTVRSFLVFPIIDLIGVKWFRLRRCHSGTGRCLPCSAPLGNLGDELYRRACRLWARTVFLALAGVAVVILFLLLPRRGPIAPASGRISLNRAERVALHQVPRGTLRTEALQVH